MLLSTLLLSLINNTIITIVIVIGHDLFFLIRCCFTKLYPQTVAISEAKRIELRLAKKCFSCIEAKSYFRLQRVSPPQSAMLLGLPGDWMVEQHRIKKRGLKWAKLGMKQQKLRKSSTDLDAKWTWRMITVFPDFAISLMRPPRSRAQVQNPASQSLPVLRGGSAHWRCWGDLARHHFFERRLAVGNADIPGRRTSRRSEKVAGYAVYRCL